MARKLVKLTTAILIYKLDLKNLNMQWEYLNVISSS